MARRYFLENPLPFGKLMDAGMVEYHEFMCSIPTFEWLKGGAMTHLDGKPVSLRVVEKASNGNVIVQVSECRV